MSDDSMVEQSRALVEQRELPAPREPKAQLMAGATPKALVPVDFEGAWRIAKTVHMAGMAPQSLDTAEKCMVAILHGLEVGLTPMNALQSIAVINGRPSIWGDGAVGLIRASGLLEYMDEHYENEDKPNMKAICIVKRKGEPKPVKTDFSMQDAATAKLLNKGGPWQTYPKRMLKMRARWALRDTFADVLKGLYLVEEMQDLERSRQPDAAVAEDKPNVPPPPEDPPAAQQAIATTAVAEVQPQQQDEAGDFPGDKAGKPAEAEQEIPLALDRRLSDNDKDWLISLSEAFEQCTTVAEIGAESDSIMMPARDTCSPYVWKKAEALMDRHIERVQGS